MALVTADSNLVTADAIVVNASGYWAPDVVTVGAVTCTPELSTVEIPDVVTVGAVTCTPELSTVEIPEAAQTLPNALGCQQGVISVGAGPSLIGYTTTQGNPSGATIIPFPGNNTILSSGGAAMIGTGSGLSAVSVGGTCGPCPDVDPVQCPDPEVEVAQAKRVDFINDLLLYRGEADPGTTDSQAGWRIRRITIGTDDDVTEEWANGTADYVHVWDNRLGYTYS